MSNYNSLKAIIDANIKQNGNQEITGQILNSVLNQIVTTLGAGYQFAGVATKDTNPGTPDAKVFYIANGKGKYEKFGGINVTEDDVVVLYWDSSWHKVSTGIASNQKLTELDFNNLKQGVIGESLEKPIFVLKHIGPDGSLINNNNKNITFEYPIYAAKGSFFYAKTGYKVQYALYNKTTLSLIKRVTWIPENQIVKLDDDYFIRIELADILESELTDTSISENLQMTLYSNLESIDAKIKNISTQHIHISQYVERAGIIEYGKWNTGDGHKHIVIPVYPNQLYRIEAGEARTGYCFLKDYQTPVAGEIPNFAEGYTGTINVEINTTADVSAPKDASYLIILSKISSVNRQPTAIYSYGEIDKKIDSVDAKIDSVDKQVDDKLSSLIDNSIELSSYPARNGIIANGVWAALYDSYQHIVVPVNGGNYIITANDETNAAYCLLKDYKTPVQGETPYYATGYTQAINITKGTSVDVVIPEDAKYMYLMVKVSDIDRTPSVLLRKGSINSTIDNEIDNIELEVEDYFYQLSQQGDNLISILGEESIVGKKITIVHPDNYSCWPFIGKVNNRLVCLYTKTDKHEGTDVGAVYVRISANGIVWTPKKLLIDTKSVRDNVTGKGNDNDGNLLFWNRVGFTDATTYYELHKSSDGMRYNILSKPTFDEVVQPTDIINIPTKGLMSFYHVYGTERKWGIITSPDNGVTWNKKELGSGTSAECPTEIYGAYLGEGRILAIGRFDNYSSSNPCLWQIQSSDYGETWSIVPTNIIGAGNTPSIVFDEANNNLHLFVYNRGTGNLEHRKISASEIWDNPTSWPSATIIATGTIGQDAGNVNSLLCEDYIISAFYSGNSVDTGIYCIFTNL